MYLRQMEFVQILPCRENIELWCLLEMLEVSVSAIHCHGSP